MKKLLPILLTIAILSMALYLFLSYKVESNRNYTGQQRTLGSIQKVTEKAPDSGELKQATPSSFDLESLRKDKTLYLRSGVNEIKIYFQSYAIVEPVFGKTDVYIGSSRNPQISLDGHLYNAYAVDINNDGKDELEIEIVAGQSLNSLVYRIINGQLHRIAVSTENPKNWEGIVSRNSPEFKDINKDGVLEMLAYYRFFPPEKRRKVEVYKFTGLQFRKVKEYEEDMPEVYL